MPANTSLKFLLVILLSLSAVKSADYAIDSGEVDASAISFDTSNPYQCACDLTANSCDYRCCCDPDCPTDQIDSIRSSGNCILTDQVNEFCSLRDSALAVVYVADRRGVQSTFFSNSTDEGVCVQVSTQGQTFDQDDLITDEDLTDERALELLAESKDKSVEDFQDNSNSYQPGFNIQIEDEDYFTIRTPGAFGECEFNYRARFAINYESQECVLRKAITATTCAEGGIFDAEAITTSLRYSPTKGSQATSSITVLSTTKIDATTGIESDSEITEPTFASAAGTCTCTNAVKSVDYYFTIGQSRVNNIQAVVTLTDVSATCGEPSPLVQSFSVNFISTDQQASIIERNQGSPGYGYGAYLRVGTQTTVGGDDAIRINNIPFPLTGYNADGECVLQQNIASSVNTNFLKFGESNSVKCAHDITSISTFCTKTANSNNWGSLGVFNIIQAGTTYFGQFGNANVNYISDFVETTGTTMDDVEITLDDSGTASCTFFTKQVVRVYYSTVGYYEQFQNYIARVEVSYEGQETIYATGTQYFETLVEFINVDSVLYKYREVGRPPFVPILPRDIFYPIFAAVDDLNYGYLLSASYILLIALMGMLML